VRLDEKAVQLVQLHLRRARTKAAITVEYFAKTENMSHSKPVGAGAVTLDVGTIKYNQFVENLYRKVPQDVTYTRRWKLQFSPSQIITAMAPTTFELPGE
jgi:hypothetical protein